MEAKFSFAMSQGRLPLSTPQRGVKELWDGLQMARLVEYSARYMNRRSAHWQYAKMGRSKSEMFLN